MIISENKYPDMDGNSSANEVLDSLIYLYIPNEQVDKHPSNR